MGTFRSAFTYETKDEHGHVEKPDVCIFDQNAVCPDIGSAAGKMDRRQRQIPSPDNKHSVSGGVYVDINCRHQITGQNQSAKNDRKSLGNNGKV